MRFFHSGSLSASSSSSDSSANTGSGWVLKEVRILQLFLNQLQNRKFGIITKWQSKEKANGEVEYQNFSFFYTRLEEVQAADVRVTLCIKTETEHLDTAASQKNYLDGWCNSQTSKESFYNDCYPAARQSSASRLKSLYHIIYNDIHHQNIIFNWRSFSVKMWIRPPDLANSFVPHFRVWHWSEVVHYSLSRQCEVYTCKTVQLFKYLYVTPVRRNPRTITMAYSTPNTHLTLSANKSKARNERRCVRMRRAVRRTGSVWKILTFCKLGRPSTGYLMPPWRDVGWPLVGYCHPFYLRRCSSRWMKTGCHHELPLFPHDLSGIRYS